MKLANLKNHFTEKKYCYIPKCLARCCADAPLPEDFLPKYKNELRRDIYSAVNIGQNDPRDTYNSVIYNTTQNPLQFIGFDQNGHKLFGITQEMIEHLQIKSMEEINNLVEQYGKLRNYCPFLTDFGRCSVYEKRPPICRDFGTLPDKINQCPEKASKLDIIKMDIRNFFDFKGTFMTVKAILKDKLNLSSNH